jgi:plasmid stabilization system protein ParE
VNGPFRLKSRAKTDVQQIWDWTANHYGEQYADKLVAAIYEDCLMLARMPGIGHKRPDLTRRNSLFWTVDDYYLIYTPDTAPLEIDRILHTSRDVRRAIDPFARQLR